MSYVGIDKMAVWEDTKRIIGATKTPFSASIKYDASLLPQTEPTRKYETEVTVVPDDCIDVAVLEQKRGGSVILLNMADIHRPGGNVDVGSPAQEECCFRRSDYSRHLLPSLYPLLGSQIIFSPGVEYIKTGETNQYSLTSPTRLDMMAIAALRFPQLDGSYSKYAYDKDRDSMAKKIDAIFRLPAHLGHDVLVLSAFGCGAYGNPPTEVVKLFQQALVRYRGSFKKVIFAVLGENYPIFTALRC